MTDTIESLRARLAEVERVNENLREACFSANRHEEVQRARADAAESALAAARERERVLVEALREAHAEMRKAHGRAPCPEGVCEHIRCPLLRRWAAALTSTPTPPAPTVGTCEHPDFFDGAIVCGHSLPCPRHPARKDGER